MLLEISGQDSSSYSLVTYQELECFVRPGLDPRAAETTLRMTLTSGYLSNIIKAILVMLIFSLVANFVF